MFKKYVIVLLVVSSAAVHAKDFGICGHVFEIAEENILNVIAKRLKGVDMDKLNNEFKERVKEIASRPVPVKGITKATENREFYYDPTYVLDRDIKDHKGNILYRAGHKVNPLTHTSLKEHLVFIDGDDASQVAFAVSYKDKNAAKIILINGSPLELQKKYKFWIYFDQAGVLTTKFGIKHIPAVVRQESKKLKIIEVKLGGNNE